MQAAMLGTWEPYNTATTPTGGLLVDFPISADPFSYKFER
jgi:hypothetical protein